MKRKIMLLVFGCLAIALLAYHLGKYQGKKRQLLHLQFLSSFDACACLDACFDEVMTDPDEIVVVAKDVDDSGEAGVK